MSNALRLVSEVPIGGNLSVKPIRPDALPQARAPGWRPVPAGLTPARAAATFARETALHLRLAGKGFWRGLMGGGIVMVPRLYGTALRCKCGDYHRIHRGQPCPVAEVDRLGLLGTKVITNAGVTFLRDDWNNNAQDLTTLNFHGCGTGTTAEAATDTALVTESTTALNPDSTRATGTRSTPSSNVYRSVGTLTFDATAAVTEHGLFSQAATGGGTLWDRTVFAAVNMGSGDSLQFTYDATLTAGG